MNIKELTERVDGVLQLTDDPEEFHVALDGLMMDWIAHNHLFAIRKQFHRLWDADVPRWYA